MNSINLLGAVRNAFHCIVVLLVTAFTLTVAVCVSADASFSDEMSDLGSDADASRGPTEPAVKRERIEMSHPLQEMWVWCERGQTESHTDQHLTRLFLFFLGLSGRRSWPEHPPAVSVCNVHRQECSNVSSPLTSIYKYEKLTGCFFLRHSATGLSIFVFAATVNECVQYFSFFTGCVVLVIHPPSFCF